MRRLSGRHAVLVVPASFQGSLGDEAMLQAVLRRCRDEGRGPIDVGYYGWRDPWRETSLGDGVLDISGLLHQRTFFRLLAWAWRLSAYRRVYLNGADVLDGRYSLSRSVGRLCLVELAATVGCQARITGFSWPDAPHPDCLQALLAMQHQVSLFVRDPVSLERLRRHGVDQVAASADLAFTLARFDPEPLAEPTLVWLSRQREADRRLLVLNLNALVFPDTSMLATAIERTRSAVEVLIAEHGVSVLLCPHDYRGDNNDQVLAERVLTGLSAGSIDFCRLEAVTDPAAVLALCREVDWVVSGRMHLAILALSVGVPACAVDYAGKVQGLFDLFGLPECVLSAERIIEDGALSAMLHQRQNLPAMRGRVQAALPTVLALAEGQI